ncbi:hypothetical protein B0I35DRAFT_163848 [Stachybotrys elegans]|uniref:Ricin B lectin domain-containing protein n=1 Tax=Stachybotrys elegans TaxID=80388 RepID=A0A8K0STJ8_9HYPO|nr:hypothetical protein B0I35DRAFT_163848 [Stachybotrys elegans]
MSSSTPNFPPITDIDSNVWYQMTEQRVDEYEYEEFTSSYQVINRTTGELAVWPANNHYWQFQPVDTDEHEGRYSLRCSETGIFMQLSVCYVPDEIAPGRTQPCMAESHGGDEQKWDVADWGNSTHTFYRFINVANGTDYWMDVHRGNPPFMSPEISTDVRRPAQRWLMTSVSEVNDGDFSTVFTNIPSTSNPAVTTTDSDTSAPPSQSTGGSGAPDPSESNSSGSGGLSAGAAAGIGIGVGLGVIALALGAFAFWWRRRRHGRQPLPSTAEPGYSPPPHDKGDAVQMGAWQNPQYNNQYAGQQQVPYYAELPRDNNPTAELAVTDRYQTPELETRTRG